MSTRGAISTAAVVSTVLALGFCPLLPAAVIFVVSSCVLVVFDVRERSLPVGWLIGSLGSVLGAVAAAALAVGEPERLRDSLLGALAAGVVVLVAARLGPHGLLVGDASYAALMGATLGWFGLPRVGLGLAFGFGVSAVLAGPIVAYTRRQAMAGWRDGAGWRHRSIPFGPPLAAGAWLALCFGEPIARVFIG